MPERLKMAKEKLDGMPDLGKGIIWIMGWYKDCKRAHTNKQHHNTEANYRWYLDMWGPAQVISVGGNSYTLVEVDGGTTKKLVELMKNQTAEMIVAILNTLKMKAKVQTGRKLKRIRTDNAPEWKSALM
ncbi:hypothetical protein D9758_011946 [Tetrapyrgos nigripes]|uniref:Integrase catalytic domain-containing protein n=1 Tax=Tetrapyrgos nigripes TaxID=182062 RepID=A0A8H5D4W3_9AGAR|nr:hypothetical protein D9758_011946 [Tetrapyrgos nigripes]